MSRDLHFSLDQLPERYRVQAAASLTRSEVKSKIEEVRSSKHHNKPPVRMAKNASCPNKTEAQFNRDVLLGLGRYEPLTLHLPGGVKYTPDYLLQEDGETYLVEVKGSYHLPTHGRSVMAFKVACAEFPMFSFLFAELGKDGRTWKIGIYRNAKLVNTVTGTAQTLHDL